MGLVSYSAHALDRGNAFAFSSRAPLGGYVVGNFGVSAQVSEANGPEFWIKVNPPKLGVWLQNFAHGELWVRESDGQGRKLSLRAVHVSRVYPEYEAIFEAKGSVRVTVNLFAPLGIDEQIGFLPGLIVAARVESDRPWSGLIGFTLMQSSAEPDSDDDPTPWPVAVKLLLTADMAGGARGHAFLVAGGAPPSAVRAVSEASGLTVSLPVKTDELSPQTVYFATGSFDRNGRYASELGNASTLAEKLISHATAMREQLRDFVDSLPRVGDPDIDRYLRWYVSAGILLTKGDRDGHVLTMGYRELNPRDSFWTSGVHLVFWKNLERTMILEIAQGQTPSGRIPVTLLPLIDRGDEIDSSEYFILRTSRYFRWYRDKALLEAMWPHVQKAIAYLSSRDIQHVGVPMQRSFWADWKDVPAEEGRRYAPHFALLWLASLRAAAELAAAMNDTDSATQYSALGDHAALFINRPYSEGGMWNGHNYVERWEDDQIRPYVLEDQVVGAVFNVIPVDRLPPIYGQLRENETSWGVREKFPYQAGWTEENGGIGGHYHNGGIWPYLNFVDATGRYLHGNTADAERIIHEVGRAGIDAGGVERPGENLDGETGANEGFPLQGWDATLFSAIYFGALGLDRPSTSRIEIHPHVPPARGFSTRLVLPACTGTFGRSAGRSIWQEDRDECVRQGINVVIEAPP